MKTKYDATAPAGDFGHNPNCDGSGPHLNGEVRVLPTGGDGNMILCLACYSAELAYRKDRNRKLRGAARFDLPQWDGLKVYDTGEGA